MQCKYAIRKLMKLYLYTYLLYVRNLLRRNSLLIAKLMEELAPPVDKTLFQFIEY